MSIRGLLFDLDGTLADTAPDLVAVLNMVLKEIHLPPAAYAVARNEVSNGAIGLLRLGLGLSTGAAVPEALRARFLKLYAENICVHSRLFIDLQIIHDYVSHHDARWGIVTNKPEALTLALLNALGIEHLPDCVVSGDTLTERKPHPAPLEYAARELKLQVDECIYIGDAPRDIEAGRAAGMRTVAATLRLRSTQRRSGFMGRHCNAQASCRSWRHTDATQCGGNMILDPADWTLIGVGALLGLLLGLLVAAWVAIRLKARLVAAEVELKSQIALEEERERALNYSTERLAHTFDQLASAQFRDHSEVFLKLARENLGTHHEKAKGELAAREQSIENLLRPIRDTMQRTESQLRELDKARRETHGNIQAQLQAMSATQHALSAETRNLVTALRRPEIRGQWGEITLQRLVELAGMVEHCDFTTQSHTATDTGAIRPDMIVNLPEGRQLVVDVKTPLDAYLEATEAATDEARAGALTRHANIVAGRVRELASKAYWAQFEKSPDFAILFIPGDQFLAAALNENPELLDSALRQNIILATPTSLVALLKAVAYGWQQVSLAENAAQIRTLAVELYERLGTFTTHVADMGKALDDSVKAYNRGVGSLERMVLPSARKFTELGVNPRKEIKPLEALETVRRDAPEAPKPGQSTPDAPKSQEGPSPH